MPKALTKVIYKPDVNSTFEYSVIINPEEFKKWKAGDTTIPLADVVDSFQIFRSEQGAQGLLGKPSNQELDNDFGTHKDTDVVEQILKKGKDQAGEGVKDHWTTKNMSRGGGNDSTGR